MMLVNILPFLYIYHICDTKKLMLLLCSAVKDEISEINIAISFCNHLECL